MPTKAALFDLDDTLYDHQYASRMALNALREAFPCFRQGAFEALERQHADLLEVWHRKMLNGLMTLDQARTERFRALFASYGEQVSWETAQESSAIYRKAYLSMERVIPGAVELLEKLRAMSIPIALVTNNNHDEQMGKLTRLKLDGLIDVLAISGAVGAAKPDPRIFRYALEQLGCQPEDAVMMGNSWTSDVLGALAVGIRAIWLNRYGLPCPDPSIATMLTSLEPTNDVVACILDQDSGGI